MKPVLPTGHTVWMRLTRRLSNEAATAAGARRTWHQGSRQRFYSFVQGRDRRSRIHSGTPRPCYCLAFCPMALDNQAPTGCRMTDTICKSLLRGINAPLR